eukprot:364412-Chlamydomonas_euryale.AAC.6
MAHGAWAMGAWRAGHRAWGMACHCPDRGCPWPLQLPRNFGPGREAEATQAWPVDSRLCQPPHSVASHLRRDRHRLRSMPDCIEQRRHVGRRGQMQRWNTLLERRQCCNRASRQQLGHKRRDVLLLDQPAGREAQHAAEHRLTIDVCSVERLGGARQLRQPLVQQVMPAVPRCVQQRAVAARVTLVVVERHAKAVTLCDHPRRQLAAARGEHIQEGRRARCV